MTQDAEKATSTNEDTTVECMGCHERFPSRNQVFRHLSETSGTCLNPTDYQDFLKYVVSQQKRQKILLLYGYTTDGDVDGASQTKDPSQATVDSQDCPIESQSSSSLIPNGDAAARLLLDALEDRQREVLGVSEDGHVTEEDGGGVKVQQSSQFFDARINRSYGSSSRSTHIVTQEDNTGALTEVLATRLPPVVLPKFSEDGKHSAAVDQWIAELNQCIQKRLQSAQMGSDRVARPRAADLRVFGLQILPSSASKFNAESDFSHRRVEYLLPMELLWVPPSLRKDNLKDDSIPSHERMNFQSDLDDFLNRFPSFSDGAYGKGVKQHHNSKGTNGRRKTDNDPDSVKEDNVFGSDMNEQDGNGAYGVGRPEKETLLFLYSLKRIMQRFTTPIVALDESDPSAVLEKSWNAHRRQKQQNTDSEHTKKIGLNSEDNVDTSTLSVPDGPESNSGHIDSYKDRISEDNELHNEGDGTRKRNGYREHDRQKKAKKKGKKTNVLRRKRFHNFTPTVMAHEFLSYRRLDRFFHRATLRFDTESGGGLKLLPQNESSKARPFVVLSLAGDIFLTGQVPRMIGLFLAVVRRTIDPDIVDCVFDEDYPHLVPTPPVPLFGMYAGEACYTKWEGKLKRVLSPRKATHWPGWNDSETLKCIQEWQIIIRERIAAEWIKKGIDQRDDHRGHLLSVTEWVDNVLEPWAVRAREQLDHYRRWKASKPRIIVADTNTPTHDNTGTAENGLTMSPSLVPPLESVSPEVPAVYERVLYYLRKADSSGLWPSTSQKRQLVMSSTLRKGCESHGDLTSGTFASSLSVAHMRTKTKTESRLSSAYIFAEGQGGASGSFSVGAMPGEGCEQPRANSTFPELMKAAFELEIALRPDREPSSTIAINRNAQFRPHTDSGAGAGQSTSLIVGLGTYSGGELVVEGEPADIRYNPIEFNGWKQRHWTMPFAGERYSLVWFTPKGCEGVRGIDLCK